MLLLVSHDDVMYSHDDVMCYQFLCNVIGMVGVIIGKS